MRAATVILLVAVAGCGTGTTADQPDLAMSITGDFSAAADLAAIADLTPAADLAGGVGAPCTDGAQCATGQCITEAMHAVYPGGYCSLLGCSDNCPAGSVCTGGGAIGNTGCFVECVLGDPCRTGYKCCPFARDLGGAGICVPATGTALGC